MDLEEAIADEEEVLKLKEEHMKWRIAKSLTNALNRIYEEGIEVRDIECIYLKVEWHDIDPFGNSEPESFSQCVYDWENKDD